MKIKTAPAAVSLYLNVTGTIFFTSGFVSVICGLYWKRANPLGGYLALRQCAASAITPFFFLHWNENVTGLASFGLATCGFFAGSAIGGLRTHGRKFGLSANPSGERGEILGNILNALLAHSRRLLRAHNDCSDRKGRPRLPRDAVPIATAKSSPLMEAHSRSLNGRGRNRQCEPLRVSPC